MIKRLLSTQIQRLGRQFPVVAVTGPRQSGKTTLLKSLFPEKRYSSLEDPDLRAYAQQDPRGFIAEHLGGGILDEVQRVPELFSYIQTIVDEINEPGQLYLSGSQNFLMSEHISQSLAGRVAHLNLLPLSIAELKSSGLLPQTPEQAMFMGGYPRIFDRNLDPNDWYSNYISTYLERDVRLIKNITNLSTFHDFIKLCAGRCGQLLDLSSLGNDCGISHNTAKAWISLLESSFIVFRLFPYYQNFSKRVIKSPKLFFYDPGLVCYLLGIRSAEDLNIHYLRGGIFESYMISEIKKSFLNKGRNSDLYFWQDSSKMEVDCIIENGRSLTAIEIKSGKTMQMDYLKNFKKWNALLPEGITTVNQLIYAGSMEHTIQGIEVFPWSDYFMTGENS